MTVSLNVRINTAEPSKLRLYDTSLGWIKSGMKISTSRGSIYSYGTTGRPIMSTKAVILTTKYVLFVLTANSFSSLIRFTSGVLRSIFTTGPSIDRMAPLVSVCDCMFSLTAEGELTSVNCDRSKLEISTVSENTRVRISKLISSSNVFSSGLTISMNTVSAINPIVEGMETTSFPTVSRIKLEP